MTNFRCVHANYDYEWNWDNKKYSQNFEPEKKKIICRSLRFLAHYHGATLQFYSAKDSGLVKKVRIICLIFVHVLTILLEIIYSHVQARDLLSHLAFQTQAGKGVSQDYNKPLIIPSGSDSFQVKPPLTLLYPGSENPGVGGFRNQAPPKVTCQHSSGASLMKIIYSVWV